MPPVRLSLLDQTVSTLLDELSHGAYPQRLPSERYLATALGISRPVLRAALEILERQGWIEIPDGNKSRRVLKRPEPQAIAQRPKRVGLLVSRPMHEMGAEDFIVLSGIIRHCEEQGWLWAIHPLDQLKSHNLHRRIQEISETLPCDIWLGFPMTNLRALALLHQKGHRVIGINCMERDPAYGVIHYDMVAARTHAFGVLLRAGRRNIIMPISQRKRAEMVKPVTDLLAEYGIRYRENFHLPVFDSTPTGFIRLLEQHFAATPRPDGIIVLYTTETSVLLLEGWLMERRLRFPQDISVIQIGSDTFLRLMHIPVSHYKTAPEPLVKAAFTAVQHYFTTGECLTGRLKLETEYCKGASV